MDLKKGLKIVNVEGKDIQRGFSFLDKNKKLALYKFKGNFDFSLGLMELNRLCEKKNITLYEEIDNKMYTKVLLCLNFNYSNKNNISKIEKNKKYKSAIINYIKNKTITEINNVKYYNNLLKCKSINPNEKQYSKNETEIEINKIRDFNKKLKSDLINNINHSLSRNSIREDLYDDGFTIDKKRYRRFLRSSGSARVGKCLFILEDVYEEMMEYALAGNEVMENMEIDLPSYEAYLGLVNTALEDTMIINPENILLVDDVESEPYYEKCMVTKLIDGRLHTDIDDYKVSNSLFDGSSLIDFSLLEEKYAIAGGVQLRNKWFKGFATGTNIQKFLIDHNITDVSQLNGWTIATDIKNIKFITTKSSIKYLKMNKGIEGFKKWLNVITNVWGICGHPHSSKFVGGKYVQSHYQLLNNIQLSKKDVEKVTEENRKYAELLKNDLEVFKMHIQAQININDTDDEQEKESENNNDINKFMNTMIKVNSNFANTKVFKRYRKEMVDNFINNCKIGHLLIFGVYAVVIMNSIDYLYHAIDKKWKATKEDSHMEYKSIMCDYFYKDYDKNLLCSRSPMPVQGNILIAKNVYNKEIKKYFSYNNRLSKYIMHINAIGTNCCERGSGFDADGDKFLITNEPTLLESAARNYNNFLVPVNAVKTNEKIIYHWNNEDKAKLDIKCSQNNIGRIINDSMILVSEYWHRINNGGSFEQLLPLYKYICELSIMSNLAIDACKRPVPYDEEFELRKIENCQYFRKRKAIKIKIKDFWIDKKGIQHNKTYKNIDGTTKQAFKKNEEGKYILRNKEAKVRPMFFKLVGEGQDYYFENFDCSMDYIQKAMKIKGSNRESNINLSDLFSDYASTLKTGSAQNREINKIVDIIKKLDNKIKAIKNSRANTKEKDEEYKKAREEVIKDLKKIRLGKGITDETMIAVLKRLDKSYQSKGGGLNSIGRLILMCLYSTYPDRFLEMFEKISIDVYQLVEDKNGDISIFNKTFSKEKVNFFENQTTCKPSNTNELQELAN